ncbi:uncharacterized protein LOC134288639 [Aedes albopictus]|uniref:Uncharacterized protein n=1 Tax=Aedes albopictus TaxID=7160 RepID=A0ABM1Y5A0_AEDAL
MISTESNVGVGGEKDPGNERIKALEAQVAELTLMIEIIQRRMRGSVEQEDRRGGVKVVERFQGEEQIKIQFNTFDDTNDREMEPLSELPTCSYCERYDHVEDDCVVKKRILEIGRRLNEEKARKGQEQLGVARGLGPECETASNGITKPEGVANTQRPENCAIIGQEITYDTEKFDAVLPVKQTWFRKNDVLVSAKRSRKRETRQVVPWQAFSESGKSPSRTRNRLNRRKKGTEKRINRETVKEWLIEWSIASERWRIWFLKILSSYVGFVVQISGFSSCRIQWLSWLRRIYHQLTLLRFRGFGWEKTWHFPLQVSQEACQAKPSIM